MKATFIFQIPEEQAEYDAARTGGQARSVLWDIDQRCRSLLKHGEPSEETRLLAEEIRAMIPGELLE